MSSLPRDAAIMTAKNVNYSLGEMPMLNKGLPLTSCIGLPHRDLCFDTCAVGQTFDSHDRHLSLQHNLSAAQIKPLECNHQQCKTATGRTVSTYPTSLAVVLLNSPSGRAFVQ